MAITTIDLKTPADQEAVKTYIKETLLRNLDTNILIDEQLANLLSDEQINNLLSDEEKANILTDDQIANLLTDEQLANLHEQNTDTSVGGVDVVENTNDFTLTGGTNSEQVLTVDETNSLSNKTDKVLASENKFASFNASGNIQNSHYSANNFESKLNNPIANGGLLSSTTYGVRSWLYTIDGGSF